MKRLPRPTVRRSVAVTAGVGTTVVALIAGVAIASGGYSAQRVDLGDASVWVANENEQAVGRASTAVLELNTVVETGGSEPEVIQRGSTVLVLDREAASVGIVDPVSSSVLDTVAVPPESLDLSIAGERVVLASDGDVWSSPVDQFAEFNSSAEPALVLGRGTKTSVNEAGVLFAFTPTTGLVRRIDATAAPAIDREWQLPADSISDIAQLTSIGDRWVILDPRTRTLYADGREADLSDELPADDPVRLQRPSPNGDTVAIAHRGGLLTVSLANGEVGRPVDDRDGFPAVPVAAGECLHAAWRDGTAWRDCGAGDSGSVDLDQASTVSSLVFVANGRTVVLNDPGNGRTWDASGAYGLIDNWDELLETERDDQTIEQNDPNRPPVVEKTQVAPVARDDEFGARPARATVLPVLLNDYDANGDVLVIETTEGEMPSWAKVDLVSNTQQLQLTLGEDAEGTLNVGYVIDDGRGGTARASVVVTVRGDDENLPPEQKRPTRALVEEGGRVTSSILGDWIDPDGDPFFLRSARVDGADSVSSTPDGVVVFDERDGQGSTRAVSLTVSDGRLDGAGALELSVKADGGVELVAEPFVVLATQGNEIEIAPLAHVRGGSGDIRLNAVPAKPDATLTPDFDAGTFRFSSTAVRTHYLEYTVTDGAEPVTGLVRVDVSAPPDRDTTPITVPHTAFVRLREPVEVDVLAGDIDPTGGLLVLTSTTDAADPGVRVEIVEHRVLRVTLAGPLPQGSTTFSYRVSNGLGDAEGTVTVIQVPTPERPQPPVAVADVVSARTGDVIDIGVLENDEHPDGALLSLAPDLERAPEAGLLFAAGDRLRYFAPDTPGEYEASYRVLDTAGQAATATVRISVKAADPATNVAPVPRTVDARVLAGQVVRIPIPLGGVDPDGDSVQLLAQETNPERGVVLRRGADWLEYSAGEYSAGTDTFEYSVVDALGARQRGLVRVGIAAGSAEPSRPIAVEDAVTVRPGRTITVRVLENDSDPSGSALSITSVETTEGAATARIVEDRLEVDIPDDEGTLGFLYTIENERLATSSSFVTIDIDSDAPLAQPEATDVVLGLSDILERDVVDVDVLRGAFLSDGDTADLGVALVPGYEEGARVLRDGDIRVEVQDRRRIVPFSLIHPDDPAVSATAFIWVPGRDDALPQLRRDAPLVRVTSGEERRIDLEDFVIAASGRPVRITDEATVSASHADGTDLVVDDDTLRFRSEDGYFGPASISFTATDGASENDPDARISTIVIPIEVLPAQDQPPVFEGGFIDFEPGQSKVVELGKLTRSPIDEEGTSEIAYRIVQPDPEQFSFELDGDELRLTANEDAPQGLRTGISVAVRDGDEQGTSGRIELRVVPSTRPLALPAADTAVVPRGRSTTVDVLANDAAGNPFPQTPLRVVGPVRGIQDGRLPAGVRIDANDDGSTLTVSVDESAEPINTTLEYQVADATGDPARYAWGTVTISVQDRPDPVTDARITGFRDGALDVAFGAGAFNNSPITGYEIALLDPATREVVSTTECAATTCTVGTPGNGIANGVFVRVKARNAIGLSDPVEAPGPIWSDVVPPPPGDLRAQPLDGALRLQWSPVPTGSGSPVSSYLVTVAGVATEISASAICTASVCEVDSQALENGTQVAFAVSARNESYPALAVWTEAGGAGTPFGPPSAGTISASGDAAAGSVTVSWAPFAGNGDAIVGYFVQRLVDGATAVPTGPQACAVSTPAPGSVSRPSSGGSVVEVVEVGAETTSLRFDGTVTESARYTFIVWGWNRAGCAHTEVAGVVVRPAPGPVGTISSQMDWLNTETWDRYIQSVDGAGSRLEIVAVAPNGAQIGGSIRTFPGNGWLRDIYNPGPPWPFGETGRVQVRTCSVWGSCGPWSGIVPTGNTPSLTFAVAGRTWDEAQATWSWAAPPANNGLPATFSCGVDGRGGRPADSASTCRITGTQPGDRVWLDVEVAGVIARFWNR